MSPLTAKFCWYHIDAPGQVYTQTGTQCTFMLNVSCLLWHMQEDGASRLPEEWVGSWGQTKIICCCNGHTHSYFCLKNYCGWSPQNSITCSIFKLWRSKQQQIELLWSGLITFVMMWKTGIPPLSASATLQWLNLLSRLSTLQTTFSMWTGDLWHSKHTNSATTVLCIAHIMHSSVLCIAQYCA